MAAPPRSTTAEALGGKCRYCAGALPEGRRLTFCPHLLPVRRGILSALYLKTGAGADRLRAALRQAVAPGDEPPPRAQERLSVSGDSAS